ncbi:MAG: cyclic lactone autoinducer peptide [Lachnospiraceae bacterium]|jgi:cyclic lactone autoinducer peptide|nr:cyclic lactone autoinducer peptide [Lachnospiraceae bacterium]
MKNGVGKLLAKTAITLTKANVNSMCYYFFYQEKLPNGYEKLKKR